jgi:hypothetical protein
VSPENYVGSNVISLDEKLRERQFRGLFNELQALDERTHGIGVEYYELMESDPETAVAQLPQWIDRMRQAQGGKNDGIAYESLAGGPNYDALAVIYNIVGSRYKDLDPPLREAIVVRHLKFFDDLNYTYSQNQVAVIDEPRLIRDIVAHSRLYWPGCEGEAAFLSRNPTIEDYHAYTQSCQSLGLLGYAIVLKDKAPLPVRVEFERSSPELLSGVLDLAASNAFLDAAHDADANDSDLAIEVETILAQCYHPDYLDDIRKKVAKAEWLNIEGAQHYPTPSLAKKLDYIDGKLVVA